MRIRAIATELTGAQRTAIGGLAGRPRAGPRIGEEHVVLGLIFASQHPRLGNGIWVIFQDEIGNPLVEPLALYEVVDPSVSRSWTLASDESRSYGLWPRAFGRAQFLETAADPRSPERAELDAISAEILAEERDTTRA